MRHVLDISTSVTFRPGERWIDKFASMQFVADMAGRQIDCTVSADALQQHFKAADYGRFRAFRENRREIGAVALRKLASMDRADKQLSLVSDDFSRGEKFIAWLQ